MAVLTEQKLLIHSLRPDVLTSVGEALVAVSERRGRRGDGVGPRSHGAGDRHPSALGIPVPRRWRR